MGQRAKITCATVACLVACGEPEAPSATKPEAPLAVAPASPLDFASIVRRAHFAFDGDPQVELVGGHSTYQARVDRVGGVTFTPVRGLAGDATFGAPFRLQPAGIECGSVHASASTIELGEDGAATVARGMATERLANSADGLSQSWSFEAAPCADGDLVVSIAVEGLHHVARSESGEHFTDPRTGLGVRYGHGTWIDADGTRTAIPVAHERGELRLNVRADLLADSAYPAVLDPVIGPEVALDEPIVGPVPGDREDPDVAAEGTQHLVVWTDYRFGESIIMGARVEADGTLAGSIIDVFPIATGQIASHPAAGMASARWLVVWESAGATPEIRARRIDSNGTLFDGPSGFVVSTAGSAREPDVAGGSSDYLVVWSDERGATGRDIHGVRVRSSTGALRDGTTSSGGIVLSAGVGDQGAPAVASDGSSTWLTAWEDHGASSVDVRGARLSGTTLLDGPATSGGFAISDASGDQVAPSIAYRSSQYVVVWDDERAGRDIYGARVSTAGALLDGPSATGGIAVSTAPNDQRSPSIGAASNFVVTWQDERASPAIYYARLSAAGELLDGPASSGGLIVSSSAEVGPPAVAMYGTEAFVVWRSIDETAGSDAIASARYATDSGLRLDGPEDVILSDGAIEQSAPSLAWNGSTYLAVWSERGEDGEYDVFGARVDSDGNVVDEPPIAISTAAGAQREPDVLARGSEFFVAWTDARGGGRSVFLGRVDDDGGLLDGPADTGGIELASAASLATRPRLANDTSTVLAVWTDRRTGTEEVFARFLGSDASLGNELHVTSLVTGAQRLPVAASAGTGYVVAFEDDSSGTTRIRSVRAASPGSVLDATPRTICSTLSTAPEILFDGSLYIVTMLQQGATTSVSAGYLSTTNTSLGTCGTALSRTGTPTSHALARAGTSFYIAWDTYGGIIGQNVDFTGPVGPLDVLVGTGTRDPRSGSPRLSAESTNAMLLGYVGFRPTSRALVRTLELRANGEPCAVGTDCRSGYCVDGVCCSTACPAATFDCRACSVAAGAAVDGECGVARAGFVCREDEGTGCDVADTCDGLSDVCPSDTVAPAGPCPSQPCAVGRCSGTSSTCFTTTLAAGTPCRSALGDCDVDDVCDGVFQFCPQHYRPAGTTCRTATGVCDVAEACTGDQPGCPADLLAGTSTLCRAASCVDGYATLETYCDGMSAECGDAVVRACAPTICSGNSCLGMCSADGQCVGAHYCDAGDCQPKRDLGEPCMRDGECAMGHCVDGYCCDGACDGACEACDVPDALGACNAVTTGSCGPMDASTPDAEVDASQDAADDPDTMDDAGPTGDADATMNADAMDDADVADAQDAATDAVADAAIDATDDAQPDASEDASVDAAMDVRANDASPDARPDSDAVDERDARSDSGGPRVPEDGGCGCCATSSDEAPSWLFLVGAVALSLRRRARRRR